MLAIFITGTLNHWGTETTIRYEWHALVGVYLNKTQLAPGSRDGGGIDCIHVGVMSPYDGRWTDCSMDITCSPITTSIEVDMLSIQMRTSHIQHSVVGDEY